MLTVDLVSNLRGMEEVKGGGRGRREGKGGGRERERKRGKKRRKTRIMKGKGRKEGEIGEERRDRFCHEIFGPAKIFVWEPCLFRTVIHCVSTISCRSVWQV